MGTLSNNTKSNYKKDVELLKEIVGDDIKEFYPKNIQVLERIIHNFEQHECNEVDLLIGEIGRSMRHDGMSVLRSND